jgi:hypothetical protein
MQQSLYEKWKQYQYYAIIGIISILALFIIPLLGSEIGLVFDLPNTAAGWIVFVISKLMIGFLSFMIFHCFILQAKINVKEDNNYKEAREILKLQSDEDQIKPRSPKEWSKQAYGRKGISLFITTTISAFGLTQAVLTFDWATMLTYLFTIVTSVIIGILQMNEKEDYWCTEYLRYAKYIEAANHVDSGANSLDCGEEDTLDGVCALEAENEGAMEV